MSAIHDHERHMVRRGLPVHRERRVESGVAWVEDWLVEPPEPGRDYMVMGDMWTQDYSVRTIHAWVYVPPAAPPSIFGPSIESMPTAGIDAQLVECIAYDIAVEIATSEDGPGNVDALAIASGVLAMKEMQAIRQAIAAHERWVLAGDDSDCCEAFDNLRHDFPYVMKWALS